MTIKYIVLFCLFFSSCGSFIPKDLKPTDQSKFDCYDAGLYTTKCFPIPEEEQKRRAALFKRGPKYSTPNQFTLKNGCKIRSASSMFLNDPTRNPQDKSDHPENGVRYPVWFYEISKIEKPNSLNCIVTTGEFFVKEQDIKKAYLK